MGSYIDENGKKNHKNLKIENFEIRNKRPRGLDALLGHLLVKIIPVTYQLSSTKIHKYLSQN